MARADVGIANIEAGAEIGYEPVDGGYFGEGFRGEPEGYGPGTTARRAVVIWGASVVWLILVWRAVEGY